VCRVWRVLYVLELSVSVRLCVWRVACGVWRVACVVVEYFYLLNLKKKNTCRRETTSPIKKKDNFFFDKQYCVPTNSNYLVHSHSITVIGPQHHKYVF